jgi:Uma2 family endonuclease
MSALPKHEPYTIADLPEDTGGARYEIIDGSLHVSPTGTNRHGLMATLLADQLNVYARSLGMIAVTSGLAVAPDRHNYLVPDVVVADLSAVTRYADDVVLHPQWVTLVVEVLSPSTRRMDVGIKSYVYADWRIPHYWLLDQETGARATSGLEGRFKEDQEWMGLAYGAFLAAWQAL